MSISLFSKNNERLAQGLSYDNFTTLATSATDKKYTIQFNPEYKA